MGETISTCNNSVSVQISNRQTSSDGGALLLREVLDRSGVIERLGRQLIDPRDPTRVMHSLSNQLRTLLIQRAQGWEDLSDTATLSDDPVFKLACSDQRSTTPLQQFRPSQPTLSRLLNTLSTKHNMHVFHDGLMELALWRLSSMRGGKPLSSITLDVDGLPIETFGSQTGTAFNRYVGYKHYSPLVASIAETGDLVGGLLREGNVGPALQADTWIPQLVERFRQAGTQVRVRIDAGTGRRGYAAKLESAQSQGTNPENCRDRNRSCPQSSHTAWTIGQQMVAIAAQKPGVVTLSSCLIPQHNRSRPIDPRIEGLLRLVVGEYSQTDPKTGCYVDNFCEYCKYPHSPRGFCWLNTLDRASVSKKRLNFDVW